MNTSRTVRSGNDRFGLFAIIESKRVILPLKGVECEFAIRGGVAEVCMNQIFRQENPKPLDCEYLFPLPADASVYSCEADINGRVIRAEVKELEQARKLAAEKKAQGFRTSLVESVRNNVFALELGNVQPDDLIIIRLKYFQTLRALDDTRSVEIPFCPGIRYIPGKPLLRANKGKGVVDDTNEVPDASRITPVRIDAGHPDAAFIDVRGTLDAACAERQSLISPSHTIDVQGVGEEFAVTLSDKGEVPDRDFVLRWNERGAETLAPRAWVRQKEGDVYALLEVRAPRQVAAQPTALDFYFLVDRSGSMKGAKWNKAVEALQSCVKVLGPDDRVMVTLFETEFRDFAERPLLAQELLADRQFQNLAKVGTGGGTELAPALEHVLDIAKEKSAGRDKNLILITDAQIGNETAILDLMKTAPEVAVHCFGIDIALNDALLLALARQQGGTFHSLNPNDDVEKAVTNLGRTLRQPVLLNLQLSPGWDCADASIPNLYAGQILYLSARGSAAKPLELTGRAPSGEPVRFEFQPQIRSEEAPYLHWCKTRIQRSLAQGQDREAIALSVSSNLICRLTAFVAWDDSEKVIVSRHALVQPSMVLRTAFCLTAGAADQSGFMDQLSCRSIPPQDAQWHTRSFSGNRNQFIGRQAEHRLADVFQAACQKLPGSDWQLFCESVIEWLDKASGDELTRRTEALERLSEKINLCADLERALRSGQRSNPAEMAKRLRVCQIQFRKWLQRNQSGDGEFKDLENVFDRIQGVDASASPEQLAALAEEVHRLAVQILKSFTESLPVRK